MVEPFVLYYCAVLMCILPFFFFDRYFQFFHTKGTRILWGIITSYHFSVFIIYG